MWATHLVGLPLTLTLVTRQAGPKAGPGVPSSKNNFCTISCEYDKQYFSLSCYRAGGGGPVIIHGRKGVIQSLGFPNPYPAHQNNSWKISVPKGFLVKLQITELAITGETGQCKEDKVIISDDYSILGEP